MKRKRRFVALFVMTVMIGVFASYAGVTARRGSRASEKRYDGLYCNREAMQGRTLNHISRNSLQLNGIMLQGKEPAATQPYQNVQKKKGKNEPLVRSVRVERTRFLVKKSDGSLATNEELIGAILVAYDERGIKEAYRIDHIETYSSPETGDIFLYTFSTKNPQTGQWVNVCEPDAKGRKMGFPLSGYWDEQGNHIRSEHQYSITATSGTIGKAVLMGYLPWGKTKSGESLWNYHQACVRLLRADYCGNRNSHTRKGTKVELWDREGIQVDTHTPGLTFEAAWNEDGAVYVKKVRIPEDYTLEEIVQECPQKLQNAAGDKHRLESFDNPRVLILNRSAD